MTLPVAGSGMGAGSAASSVVGESPISVHDLAMGQGGGSLAVNGHGAEIDDAVVALPPVHSDADKGQAALRESSVGDRRAPLAPSIEVGAPPQAMARLASRTGEGNLSSVMSR